MKPDWHDMCPTGRYAPSFQIQWSPTGEVRAKHNHETTWRYAKCEKATYAESIGLNLLSKR